MENRAFAVVVLLAVIVTAVWINLDVYQQEQQAEVQQSSKMLNKFVEQCELERSITSPNEVVQVQKGRMYLGLSIADLDPTPGKEAEKTYAEYIHSANVATIVCQPYEIRVLQQFQVLRVPDMMQRVIVSAEQRRAAAIEHVEDVARWQKIISGAAGTIGIAAVVLLILAVVSMRRRRLDLEL